MSDSLSEPLYRHSISNPQRLALAVAGRAITYGELARLGRTIARWLLTIGGGMPGRVGVLAGRSLGAYAGVVGSCWAGATYVPLGLGWPEDRLIDTLRQTRLDALIVDREGAPLLSPRLLAAVAGPILLAGPGSPQTPDARFDSLRLLPDSPNLRPLKRPDDHIAYIIFTSGTTGVPKGVAVSLGAITRHLDIMQLVYGFTAADRVSLAFDLTFDPSILNMFMTWNAGASLHVAPAAELFAPVGFIRDRGLSVWNSAPTTIGLLMTLGALPPGSLPRLRISIFGGDTLTLAAAQAWQRAAPGSTVDNVYGPTEATIECLHQRLTDPPVITPERGSLALGLPYAGTDAAIVDDNLHFLPPGKTGELAISGLQLAVGYLDQPELTAVRFPTIGGRRWYLTGDIAYQDGLGRFHHLGRRDDQVKVRGHRIELGDVDSHLRRVCGTELVASIAWPLAGGSPAGIVGFIACPDGELWPPPRQILDALKRRLPPYMMPQRIVPIAALPMTPHGKVDRPALVRLLEADRSRPRRVAADGRGSAGLRPARAFEL